MQPRWSERLCSVDTLIYISDRETLWLSAASLTTRRLVDGCRKGFGTVYITKGRDLTGLWQHFAQWEVAMYLSSVSQIVALSPYQLLDYRAIRAFASAASCVVANSNTNEWVAHGKLDRRSLHFAVFKFDPEELQARETNAIYFSSGVFVESLGYEVALSFMRDDEEDLDEYSVGFEAREEDETLDLEFTSIGGEAFCVAFPQHAGLQTDMCYDNDGRGFTSGSIHGSTISNACPRLLADVLNGAPIPVVFVAHWAEHVRLSGSPSFSGVYKKSIELRLHGKSVYINERIDHIIGWNGTHWVVTCRQDFIIGALIEQGFEGSCRGPATAGPEDGEWQDGVRVRNDRPAMT